MSDDPSTIHSVLSFSIPQKHIWAIAVCCKSRQSLIIRDLLFIDHICHLIMMI